MRPANNCAPAGDTARARGDTNTVDEEILPQSDSPFATRRRFLILAAMAGWVQPERVTERILQDLADEVAP
jgi:hypothetical protein